MRKKRYHQETNRWRNSLKNSMAGIVFFLCLCVFRLLVFGAQIEAKQDTSEYYIQSQEGATEERSGVLPEENAEISAAFTEKSDEISIDQKEKNTDINSGQTQNNSTQTIKGEETTENQTQDDTQIRTAKSKKREQVAASEGTKQALEAEKPNSQEADESATVQPKEIEQEEIKQVQKAAQIKDEAEQVETQETSYLTEVKTSRPVAPQKKDVVKVQRAVTVTLIGVPVGILIVVLVWIYLFHKNSSSVEVFVTREQGKRKKLGDAVITRKEGKLVLALAPQLLLAGNARGYSLRLHALFVRRWKGEKIYIHYLGYTFEGVIQREITFSI